MEKKFGLRLISIFMVMCVFALCFVGCNNEEPEEPMTSYRAISIAKNNYLVQMDILDCWGLEFAYEPNWGSCTAEQDADGKWIVTLKGTISGYTDEYKKNFISNKAFEATVWVNSEGDVKYSSVDKVYK